MSRWNGAYEDQAVDRAHRLGQTRPVHVTKLIMKRPGDDPEDCVEQRILELQVRPCIYCSALDIQMALIDLLTVSPSCIVCIFWECYLIYSIRSIR